MLFHIICHLHHQLCGSIECIFLLFLLFLSWNTRLTVHSLLNAASLNENSELGKKKIIISHASTVCKFMKIKVWNIHIYNQQRKIIFEDSQ